MRHLWRSVGIFLAVGFLPAGARAQTSVALTDGVVARANSRTESIHLIGPETEINGRVAPGPVRQFVAGTRGDLSATVTHSSTEPFRETVNGTTYQSVWITATFSFTTAPFAVHTAREGTVWRFETPFTMEGTVNGYSDSALTNQVFSVSLACSGVAAADARQFTGGVWTAQYGASESWLCTRPIPSPWTPHDVGDVGVAGAASYSDTRFSFMVAGGGADIWGTSDAFHFVSQPLEGDGELVARVVGQQVTDPFAKAGIMLRQSLAPDAPYVILDRKPDGGVELMTRASAGAATTFVAGTPPRFDWYVKLTRAGSTVTGSISWDGISWTLVGSTTLDGPVLAGLVVTSHDDTVLNQAVFDVVRLVPRTGIPSSSLPEPWRDADIGDTGQTGSASRSTDVFTVRGAGADIWGTSDSFHYVYVPMNGSGEATVTVGALGNTDAFAKAGVMIRASTDPDAAHVILDVKPDGGIELMARTSTGAETTFVAGGMVTSFPVELRLDRIGAQVESLFVASVFDRASAAWRQIGDVTVTMPPEALIGMAVTSHDRETLTTATFSAKIVRNLIVKGGFEEYEPPSLGAPGWISDTPFRQVDAVSQASQPHSGAKNGACVTTDAGDCGMYQDIVIPENGSYRLTVFATADRSGGLVGLNSGDTTIRSQLVDPRGFGNYGAGYSFEFFSLAGRVIRVWLYSPATPGYVAIDDVTLVQIF